MLTECQFKPMREYKTHKTKMPTNKIKINPQPCQGSHRVFKSKRLFCLKSHEDVLRYVLFCG